MNTDKQMKNSNLPLNSINSVNACNSRHPCRRFLLQLLLLVVIAGSAEAKLNVVVTTPDLASIAKEVGGDHVDISTLAKPTEDPHFVDAKPSFIVKLNHAEVLIEGGAEL